MGAGLEGSAVNTREGTGGRRLRSSPTTAVLPRGFGNVNTPCTPTPGKLEVTGGCCLPPAFSVRTAGFAFWRTRFCIQGWLGKGFSTQRKTGRMGRVMNISVSPKKMRGRIVKRRRLPCHCQKRGSAAAEGSGMNVCPLFCRLLAHHCASPRVTPRAIRQHCRHNGRSLCAWQGSNSSYMRSHASQPPCKTDGFLIPFAEDEAEAFAQDHLGGV